MTQRQPTPAERIAKQWGDRLKARRTSLRMTQTELATQANYNQTTISRYERGEAPWTPEAMIRFAAVLGTDCESLFPWPMGVIDAERFRLGIAA